MSLLDTPPTTTVESHPDGDGIHIDVRLVVAPQTGRFHPAEPGSAPLAGELIGSGTLIGHVVQAGTTHAVRSFCSGLLVQVLAEPDDQVRVGEPLAWVRPVGR